MNLIQNSTSMSAYLLKNATLVNEGKQFKADILIENERISKIITSNQKIELPNDCINIDLSGKYIVGLLNSDAVHTGKNIISKNISDYNLSPGIYTVRLSGNTFCTNVMIVVQ